MKSLILAVLGSLVFVSPVFADAEVIKSGFAEPKIDVRRLLEIAGELSGKQVIVENEADLQAEISFVLRGPVNVDAAQKVVSSLLLLEGFALEENGNELHFRRVLTRDQVNDLNSGLGRPEPSQTPRRHILMPAGSKEQKEWIIVRPQNPGAEKKEQEPGKDQPPKE